MAFSWQDAFDVHVGNEPGLWRPETCAICSWLDQTDELVSGPQHDELTPRGRLVAELHTFGVRDPDLDRIADIATTARDGAAGDWPCSFHVEPTPGCEMCRNVGGSGQRLEMPRDGATPVHSPCRCHLCRLHDDKASDE